MNENLTVEELEAELKGATVNWHTTRYQLGTSGQIDQDQLEAAFAALHGRPATADDRQAGLWSLCCAATPNCGTRPE